MSNVKITAEHVARTQTLRAMERLMISMGSRNDYIAWLQAMPEDAVLNPAGGLSMDTVGKVAADDVQYDRAVRAFALHMGKVLANIEAE